MIVEVITEGLDVGDVLVAAMRCKMAREKNCRLSEEVEHETDGAYQM